MRSSTLLFASALLALATAIGVTQTWLRAPTAGSIAPYLSLPSSSARSSVAAPASSAAPSAVSSKALALPAGHAKRMFALAKRLIIIRETQAFVADVKNVPLLRQKYPLVYALAAEGDVLITTKTHLILYRPSLDILVDVLPARAASFSSR